jgi:hypothetical protein
MNNGWLKLDDKTFVYEYSRTLRLVYLLLAGTSTASLSGYSDGDTRFA